MPSSFVPAARRCTREEARTCKLRSELISVEDKRNESERESRRRRDGVGEIKADRGEKREHVAVPRSTAHNVRKQVGKRASGSGREAPTLVRYVG